MVDSIKDGTGTGNLAKVDSRNRVHAKSVSISEEFDANNLGDAYNINTGVVSLTDSVDTPMLYIKNNETEDLIIVAVVIGLGISTGGDATDWIKGTFIRNPTAGTIVSSPVDVEIKSNRNYGSSNTLTADTYKGATGKTMTDGEDHILVQLGGGNSRSFIAINEELPTGTSFGVKIDPLASNTAMDCYVAVICYLKES